MSASVRSATGYVGAAPQTSYGITETAGSPQAGDTRFVFLATAVGATFTLPTGWATIFNGAAYTSGRVLLVISKAWATGAGTETITLSASNYVAVEIVSVSGLDTAATPQLSHNGSGTAATSLTATGLTPTTSDQLALVFYVSFVSTGTCTFTAPSGTTVIDNRTGSAPADVPLLASKAITSTAATGNFVATTSASNPWLSAVLLVPSAAIVSTSGMFFPYLGLGAGVSR